MLGAIIQGILQGWYIWLIFLVILFLKIPRIKGFFGELLVNKRDTISAISIRKIPKLLALIDKYYKDKIKQLKKIKEQGIFSFD